MGRQSQSLKLDSQPVAEGSLSRRRRAGNQDEFLFRLPRRLFRNLSDILFLKGLLHEDQLVHAPAGNHLV